jgi:hypothetical protein
MDEYLDVGSGKTDPPGDLATPHFQSYQGPRRASTRDVRRSRCTCKSLTSTDDPFPQFVANVRAGVREVYVWEEASGRYEPRPVTPEVAGSSPVARVPQFSVTCRNSRKKTRGTGNGFRSESRRSATLRNKNVAKRWLLPRRNVSRAGSEVL